MSQDDQYYLAYDDRYHRMHKKGFDRWVSDPEEAAGILRRIDTFLIYANALPGSSRIIEFGCGEGLVGEHLIDLGYFYLGIDISREAIVSARTHIGERGKDSFLIADILRGLDMIEDGSRDIVIDNQCFHMLVTDEHRRKYLSEINQVLNPGGRVFFRLTYQAEPYCETVQDYDDWLEKTGITYDALHNYPAWKGGECFGVDLPRVPARFNNESGYRQELAQAGLSVEYFEIDGGTCIIYVKKTIDRV